MHFWLSCVFMFTSLLPCAHHTLNNNNVFDDASKLHHPKQGISKCFILLVDILQGKSRLLVQTRKIKLDFFFQSVVKLARKKSGYVIDPMRSLDKMMWWHWLENAWNIQMMDRLYWSQPSEQMVGRTLEKKLHKVVASTCAGLQTEKWTS